MLNKNLQSYTFLFRNKPQPDKIRSLGGFVIHVGRHSGIVSAFFPSRQLMRLIKEDSELVFAEQDQMVSLPSPKIVAVYRQRPNVSSTQRLTWNVERVWRGRPSSLAGRGVRVGVIDTGIDLSHPDLRGNIKGGVNLVQPGKPPQDDNGHGTHTAGIIAARDNALGVVGVAPSASLYAIKVLNSRGVGPMSHLVRGIEWAIDNRMHIINISISAGRTVSPSLIRAVNAAVKRGILVVAAAGNEGNAAGTGDNVTFPARIPAAVAVAALSRQNRRAPFSSTGPAVDIAAPGVEILSTYAGGRYALLTGTSQASPHVSGAAAVYKGQGASAAAIRKLLASRAIPLGSVRSTGAGLVQIR